MRCECKAGGFFLGLLPSIRQVNYFSYAASSLSFISFTLATHHRLIVLLALENLYSFFSAIICFVRYLHGVGNFTHRQFPFFFLKSFHHAVWRLVKAFTDCRPCSRLYGLDVNKKKLVDFF
jgi:hypothetical protein